MTLLEKDNKKAGDREQGGREREEPGIVTSLHNEGTWDNAASSVTQA